MMDASARMRERLRDCAIGSAAFPVISNVTGLPHSDSPDSIRSSLADQIVSPVLWNSTMGFLLAAGHRFFVEAGPGKVLTGLVKDFGTDARAYTAGDPDSLAKLMAARAEPVSG
jgi:[acyl-carrier-protein] S-malonyltransferase